MVLNAVVYQYLRHTYYKRHSIKEPIVGSVISSVCSHPLNRSAIDRPSVLMRLTKCFLMH